MLQDKVYLKDIEHDKEVLQMTTYSQPDNRRANVNTWRIE